MVVVFVDFVVECCEVDNRQFIWSSNRDSAINVCLATALFEGDMWICQQNTLCTYYILVMHNGIMLPIMYTAIEEIYFELGQKIKCVNTYS